MSHGSKTSGEHDGFFWLTDARVVRPKLNFPKPHEKLRVDERRVQSGTIFLNRPRRNRRDLVMKQERTVIFVLLRDLSQSGLGLGMNVHRPKALYTSYLTQFA